MVAEVGLLRSVAGMHPRMVRQRRTSNERRVPCTADHRPSKPKIETSKTARSPQADQLTTKPKTIAIFATSPDTPTLLTLMSRMTAGWATIVALMIPITTWTIPGSTDVSRAALARVIDGDWLAAVQTALGSADFISRLHHMI